MNILFPLIFRCSLSVSSFLAFSINCLAQVQHLLDFGGCSTPNPNELVATSTAANDLGRYAAKRGLYLGNVAVSLGLNDVW